MRIRVHGTRIAGTWREDGRRRRRVRRAERNREEEKKRLTGGPGEEFSFLFFSFFSLGYDSHQSQSQHRQPRERVSDRSTPRVLVLADDSLPRAASRPARPPATNVARDHLTSREKLPAGRCHHLPCAR